jgi:hypothetical protein
VVVIETGSDSVRREDKDHKGNIGMLKMVLIKVNLF